MVETQTNQTDTQNSPMLAVLKGMVHDINNTLTTALVCHFCLAKERQGSEDWSESYEIGEKSLKHCAQLMQSLANYSKGLSADAQQECNVSTLIADAVSLAFAGTKTRTDLLVDEGLPLIPANPTQLMQVFINLLISTRQSISDGALIGICCTRSVAPAGSSPELAMRPWVTIRVADHGEPGRKTLSGTTTTSIADASRTKDVGLSIVKRIVESHGGVITLSSGADGRETTSVSLPC